MVIFINTTTLRSRNLGQTNEIEIIGATAVMTMTALTVIEVAALLKIQGYLKLKHPNWAIRLLRKIRVEEDDEKEKGGDNNDDRDDDDGKVPASRR